MAKVTKEIYFKGMSFDFIREENQMKMYISKDSDYCIIVDKEDNVIFEVMASTLSKNIAVLEDAVHYKQFNY